MQFRALESARRLAASCAGEFMAERERWPLWLPVLIGAGIGIYFSLPREPPLWLGAALVAAACVGLVLGWRYAATLGAALLALAIGFAAAQFETWSVAAPVLQERLGPVVIEGRLVA